MRCSRSTAAKSWATSNRSRSPEHLGRVVMRNTWLLAAVGLLLAAAGCKSQLDLDAKDPNVYARSIKKDVQALARTAREPKQSTAAVKNAAETFQEKLKGYSSHPVGDNK